MGNLLNSQGLTIATYAELLAIYTTGLQAIYGSQVNLASDTPDGQWINITIQAVLDLEDLVQSVYSSFDPDQAVGVTLDQRCAINGVTRQAGTYTLTNVTLTVSATYSPNLYGLDQSAQAIYTVADQNNNQYQLVNTVIGLLPGSHALVFQAANTGAIAPTINTITVPVTIVLGISAINNPTIYTQLGTDEESDLSLKIRRAQSVSIPSQGFFQGLTAALEDISGISSAAVHENDGGSTDVNGIPGHSIWVVTSGSPAIELAVAYNSATTYSYNQIASSAGVNYISIQNNNLNHNVLDTAWWSVYNPIAQTIYTYRNAGCGMYGTLTYNIGQLDGSFFPVYWDTVTEVSPFIKVSTRSLNQINPPNLAAINAYITENFKPAVAAEININQVTSLSQIADPNTLVVFPSGYGLSTSAGGAYTYTLTPTALNYQFSIASSHIILLPIVMTCPNASFSFDANGVVQSISVNAINSQQIVFNVVGGYGTLTWSNSGTGTFTPSTGSTTTYTAIGFGPDVLTITDSLGNTMIANITVAL